ncbi:MAG: WYL domain-containing protein [Deltaproteobacteria bacterium]|nr:WYL domain-containing protein [Deltaproteobacteria bacterium]
MGDHLGFERYFWFDQAVRRRAYPNAAGLARRFELSPKTAARAIAFMRERLGAPLEYVPARRGYRYSDETFELPGCRVSPEELLAVLLARRLLGPETTGLVADAFRSLAAKLRLCLGGFELGEEDLDTRLSASWAGYAPASPATFRTVLEALLADRVLAITYASPLRSPSSQRLVEPHHLRHYLGSWILTAWCRTRGDWRAFYLSRVETAESTGVSFAPRSQEEWRPRLDGGFGAFQGDDITPVTLRFNAFRSPWIREQVWHPAQTLRPLPDGGVELTVPAADLREVKMKVLSFGADVEVIGPEELRSQVAEEAERLAALYRCR